MAVVIDTKKEVETDIRDLENGVELVLTDGNKKEIVMTKFVTTNPNRFGFKPEGEWFDQVTTDVGGGRKSVRLQVAGENEAAPRAVTVDDGLIIDLIGTLTKVVGLMPGRAPMSEIEVDMHIEQTEEMVPLYEQWDFRVARVLLTDGPEGRIMLNKSEDQKRSTAEARMFDTFAKMFQTGNSQKFSEGEIDANATETLKAGIAKITSSK